MPDFLVNNNFYQLTASLDQPIVTEVNVLEPRAVFSIDASNMLRATGWLVQNGQHVKVGLGTLSFTIRDKDGVAIGVSGSDIAADSNGFFLLGPVSGASIQDLTHYTVDLAIGLGAQTVRGVVAITLGE